MHWTGFLFNISFHTFSWECQLKFWNAAYVIRFIVEHAPQTKTVNNYEYITLSMINNCKTELIE